MKDDKFPFLGGVYAASSTPMLPDLTCDVPELAKHCKDLLRRGCNGVVIFGTTGEGVSFSVNERKRILKALIEQGIPSEKLIIGASFCSVDEVVELSKEAIKYCCAAILIVPPFFYKKVDDHGIIAFYKEVIQQVASSELKILLYHIPQYSGVPFTISIIKSLYEKYPNHIIGLKESEGNLSLTKDVLTQIPNFKVFVGNDLQLPEAVRLGAAGGITGFANVFPELVCSLFRNHEKNDLEKHLKVIEEIKLILKEYSLFSAIKSIIAYQKGTSWLPMRPPLVSLSESQSQRMISSLKKLMII